MHQAVECRQVGTLAAAIGALGAAQRQAMSGTLWDHLQKVEMPAALEHALITMTGVRLDRDRCKRLRTAVPVMVTSIKERLAKDGLTEPEKHSAVVNWLRKIGILDAFNRNKDGAYEIDDDTLKEQEVGRPLIRALRQLRKIEAFADKQWLKGMMTSIDGRVHPDHLPLQAPTTRSSTCHPELASLPKKIHEMVIPEPGNGIIELDYKGVEVLTAAIRFGDKQLFEAYATGDVISYLARVIFPERLQGLSLEEIAKHHDELRGQSKTTVYGVLYGRKAHSLKRKLKVSERTAQQLIDRLMAFCPAVEAGMKAMVEQVRRDGRIPIAFDLVRHLTKEERGMGWKVETLGKNTPIQGLAAVVFRWAMVLVARAIEPLGGQIILPVHDAFVLEGPLGNLPTISAAAKQAMIDAFEIISSTALPIVEVDGVNPSAWCKKGKVGSFEKYLEDPTAE